MKNYGSSISNDGLAILATACFINRFWLKLDTVA
jgi:hypothetical protein